MVSGLLRDKIAEARWQYERAMWRGNVARADDALSELETMGKNMKRTSADGKKIVSLELAAWEVKAILTKDIHRLCKPAIEYVGSNGRPSKAVGLSTGDFVWVKEPFVLYTARSFGETFLDYGNGNDPFSPLPKGLATVSTGGMGSRLRDFYRHPRAATLMRRNQSRLTLIVQSTRQCFLTDLEPADFVACGARPSSRDHLALWGGAWKYGQNPRVVLVDFETVKANIDSHLAGETVAENMQP